MKNSLKIKLKKERVILSDTLPYETPITFSNRFFYEFITDNRIEVGSKFDKVSWLYRSEALDKLIFLIFGIDDNKKERIITNGNARHIEFSKSDFITIPFFFGISHKEDSSRRLAVMHPRNQVYAISFYDRYKEIILYNCGKSKFSLRYPARIAKSRIFDDERKSTAVSIENNLDKKKCNLKSVRSFFSYRKMRNVHEFFESDAYIDCEKRYNFMAQLDVSKCFDSIYTHSISWAVLGKNYIKEQLAEKKETVLHNNFSDNFDKMMQTQNYNETNGIIVGPETSRIFAELIFQRIDCDIENALALLGLNNNKEYTIFRYVDDFFVFYNEDAAFKKISSQIESSLREYKLGVNIEKSIKYSKPIITESTIAKKKISSLLDEKINLEIEESCIHEGADKKIETTGKISINLKPLITSFKIIIKESNAEYKNVSNYTMAIIEKKIKSLLKKFNRITIKNDLIDDLISSLIACVDFCFFIYSVSPRVNSTIKLCRILTLIIEFCKSTDVNLHNRHVVFKRIFDNANFVFGKFPTTEFTQVETIYLLPVLCELGKEYYLDQDILIDFLPANRVNGKIIFNENSNYFLITSLLFYIKNKVRYKKIKLSLKRLIISKIKKTDKSIKKDSELIHLILDAIACPYFDRPYKSRILRSIGIIDKAEQREIISANKNWFTKWEDFKIGRELDSKQSVAVY